MLSQFTGEPNDVTLKNLFNFPKDVYPVGRLDKDSEGLLLLTNDARINQLLLHPTHQHHRVYMVQVENIPNDADLKKLEHGVEITVDGKKYETDSCKATLISDFFIEERVPPIRKRLSIPTSWIQLKLSEGKNRQVRKMTAAIGFPTLRLLRIEIENLHLKDLGNNKVKEYTEEEIYHLLNLKK